MDYATQVKPLLRRCLNCHGPSDRKSEFRMETREGLLKGGEISDFLGEPTVEPGNADKGLLIRFVLTPEDDPDNEVYRMPPEGERLTPEQIVLLRQWINQGLEWPPGATLIPDPEDR